MLKEISNDYVCTKSKLIFKVLLSKYYKKLWKIYFYSWIRCQWIYDSNKDQIKDSTPLISPKIQTNFFKKEQSTALALIVKCIKSK